MKIKQYNFLPNSVVIHFDIAFKQINYVKMESSDDVDLHGTLECDEMEIKYSKRKNTLNLFINETTNMIIVFITELDNKHVSYCYYIKRQNELLHSNVNFITNGLSKLLSNVKNDGDDDEKNPDENSITLHPIKNQNIFAKIVKKSNNGAGTSM